MFHCSPELSTRQIPSESCTWVLMTAFGPLPTTTGTPLAAGAALLLWTATPEVSVMGRGLGKPELIQGSDCCALCTKTVVFADRLLLPSAACTAWISA